MELAALIRQARTEAGMSRPQLAAAIGCTKKAVELWEHGHRVDVGFANIVRLARATGKPLDFFAAAID